MSENNKENSTQEQENPWVSLGKDLLSVVAVLITFHGPFQAGIRALDSYGCSGVRKYGTAYADRRYYFHQKHRSSEHNHE